MLRKKITNVIRGHENQQTEFLEYFDTSVDEMIAVRGEISFMGGIKNENLRLQNIKKVVVALFDSLCTELNFSS